MIKKFFKILFLNKNEEYFFSIILKFYLNLIKKVLTIKKKFSFNFLDLFQIFFIFE
jgi:hypothetical protein